MTARRSPSTLMGSPLLVLMVRMLSPEAFDRVRKIGEDRIHQPRFADADDGDAAAVVGFHIHQLAPVRLSIVPFWPKSSPRSLRIWRASSVRPRLIRDFTVPSGSRSLSAISW